MSTRLVTFLTSGEAGEEAGEESEELMVAGCLQLCFPQSING